MFVFESNRVFKVQWQGRKSVLDIVKNATIDDQNFFLLSNQHKTSQGQQGIGDKKELCCLALLLLDPGLKSVRLLIEFQNKINCFIKVSICQWWSFVGPNPMLISLYKPLFITNFDWKTSHLYVLPKIHKSKDIIEKVTQANTELIEMQPPSTLKCRPIVAGPSSPTQRRSEFLDTSSKPLAKTLQAYVRDD